MNDPHVEALYYYIGTGSDSISYGDPADMSFDNDIGRFDLVDCTLTVTPVDHFADVDSARTVVDPFLKAWEVYTDLTANLGQVRFTFKDAKLIDRAPLPHGSGAVSQVKGASMILLSGQAKARMTCGKYPAPPGDFRTSPEVEMAHMRWEKFRQGKDSLQTAAYFILTLVETSAGGRKAAAKKYRISSQILNRIGELSSTRGNAETARKASFQEMNGEERQWLESAIRDLILQMGRQ